MLLKWLKRPNH